ncbi:MAG: hypothetical protein Altm2KO_19920 [Alteromonas macleodii]|jgi:hypothetical protein|uniref:Uncharacterized protein n=1 Tax=Alteromonas australica TaxID=589873 RepID=A0A350P457_9ALTE|nr:MULTISPECIES: hypothetical protein [Alteromonas]MBR9895437.1 hypothetical protein [Gammaproteobacteria bacterium]MCG8496774.1 hypothetical protein [Enterobacterales bacterium]MEA3380487.1 hypothetical protein [Pseudomonadota bacterium]MDM7963581.1 hypothetical protein [Alteromonas macleodii]MDM8172024.1 hypothetical protein [Alteromonas macleodii]|tara:strand:- start:3855 stop:4061 length:207 start_codon:yes stop_codon:yes gene_type:complete
MYKQVYDAKGNHTGTFDGEYVYDLSGKILYRVDNDEVYNTIVPCKYLGSYENGQATKIDGSSLFRVSD